MNKSLTSDYIIAYSTLISGLSISAVAVYYSVVGLISLFAAATVPIMIMGIALEVSKLIVSMWLKRHWKDASKLMVTYLTFAVIILMMITSMGVYGFLSKAHLDQAIPAGDIADKVALLDEKINTYKDNIEVSRKSLLQMDEAVDQTMARSSSEKGANRSVQIRRSQAKERAQLQSEISQYQLEISKLNDEKAPIAKELRKVDAEVGPLKYIAALIYGDQIDSNILEKAVRWIIILIVAVFDPLAVILLLSSQHSFKEIKSKKELIQEIKTVNHDLVILPDESIPPMPKLKRKYNRKSKSNNSSDQFPPNPKKGDICTRSDYKPPRNFTYNGNQWVGSENYNI